MLQNRPLAGYELKIERKQRRNKMGMKIQTPVHEEIAEWLLAKASDRIFSGEEVAKEIYDTMKSQQGKEFDSKTSIDSRRVSEVISRARVYLELNKKCTIITVIRQGYKIASAKEATIFGVKTFKRMTRAAETALRRGALIRKDFLGSPELKHDIEEIRGSVKTLASFKDRLALVYQPNEMIKE